MKQASVEKCIAYIESCGYALKRRARSYYLFYNPKRPPEHRYMAFSLASLRATFVNGW